VQAQGRGYWMGVGAVFDRDGNDAWTAVADAMGSATGGGAGVLIDRAGDDTRTVTAGDGLAVAGEWAIGVAVDYAGNDTWRLAGMGLGSADGNGIALFADAAGDDEYVVGSAAVLGAVFPAGEGAMRGLAPTIGLAHDAAGFNLMRWEGAALGARFGRLSERESLLFATSRLDGPAAIGGARWTARGEAR
jgi:hypothetical protein